MTYSQIKAIYKAFQSPSFTHARARRYGTAIYHKDPASPSGVFSVACGPNDVVAKIMRRVRDNSPLSPTEGLMQGLRPTRGC